MPTIEPLDATTITYDGWEYRTMMQTEFSSSDLTCHPNSEANALAMPDGYEVAPDDDDIIDSIVATFPWETHVTVLYSPSGLCSGYPAYGTAAFYPGEIWGDSQAKARITSDGRWWTPWTCYQILIRRSVSTAPSTTPAPTYVAPDDSCADDYTGTNDSLPLGRVRRHGSRPTVDVPCRWRRRVRA